MEKKKNGRGIDPNKKSNVVDSKESIAMISNEMKSMLDFNGGNGPETSHRFLTEWEANAI